MRSVWFASLLMAVMSWVSAAEAPPHASKLGRHLAAPPHASKLGRHLAAPPHAPKPGRELAAPAAVAVLPFEVDGRADGADGRQAADLLATFLSESPRLAVVERDVMEAVWEEQGFSAPGFSREDGAPALGRLLAARYVVRGSLEGARGSARARAAVIETETGRWVRAEEASGSDRAQVLRELARRLGEVLSVPLAPGPDLPADSDPQTSLLLARGFVDFHRRRFTDALSAFVEVLALRPDHPEARLWLGKAFLEAGFPEHARPEMEEFLRRFPAHPGAAEAQRILGETRGR